MKNIQVLEPAELDQVLKNKYGLQLFAFAEILSILADWKYFINKFNKIAYDGNRLKDSMPRPGRRGIKRRLQKLKRDATEIQRLFHHGSQSSYYSYLTEQVDEDILDIDHHLLAKGKPPDPANLLIFLWAVLVKRNSKAKADFEMLYALSVWFLGRLPKTKPYQQLHPSEKQSQWDSLNSGFFKRQEKWNCYYDAVMGNPNRRLYPHAIYFASNLIFHTRHITPLTKFRRDCSWAPINIFCALKKTDQNRLNKILQKHSDKNIVIFPDLSYIAS